MNWCECIDLIKNDYVQLVANKQITQREWILGSLKKLITNASYKVTFWFRIGNYLKSKGSLFKPFYLLVSAIYRHYQYKTGIQLYLGTKVGGGLFFPHYGCQILHYAAEIGQNVHIYQGVTIGSVRGRGGAPKIGNNVVLFSGAKIIGDVTIGDNCVIGAGAVVTKDVPPGCVAAGVPAKILSQKGREIVELYVCN